jgi:hypothetical protein
VTSTRRIAPPKETLCVAVSTTWSGVGSVKVHPVGFNLWVWDFEAHFIVAGAKRDRLFEVFREVPCRIINDVVVTPVKNVQDAVDDALNCNKQARLSESFRLRQRQEFYAWLLNMKIGSRVIRYGCDEEFRPLVSVSDLGSRP